MYKQGLIAAIKVDGKVLKELEHDKVYLPFGAEYSIFIKNPLDKKVMVNVTIDGQEAISDLVVYGNQAVDVERFLKRDGNKAAGNKFKFIERNVAVEGYRGVEAEDGLVQIEYQFEKKTLKSLYEKDYDSWKKYVDKTTKEVHHYHHYNYTYGWPQYGSWTSNGIITNSAGPAGGGTTFTNSVSSTLGQATADVATQGYMQNFIEQQSVNEAGITVAGGISEQKFTTVADFEKEAEKHVMVLHLLGTWEKHEVKKPVTVKTNIKCSTCGYVNEPMAKFCSRCGTGLVLVK